MTVIILCGFSFLILGNNGISKLLSSAQPKVLMLIKLQIPLSLRPEQDLRSGGFVVVFVKYNLHAVKFILFSVQFCEFGKIYGLINTTTIKL